MGTYSVGEAARAAGVSTRAVRLYEAKGLLAEPGRTSAGYRVLTDDHVDTLEFIRRGRSLGLSLNDIGEIMDIAASGRPCCDRTRALLARRVSQIDAAIADLTRLRATIVDAQLMPVDQVAGTRCAVIESARDA